MTNRKPRVSKAMETLRRNRAIALKLVAKYKAGEKPGQIRGFDGRRYHLVLEDGTNIYVADPEIVAKEKAEKQDGELGRF
jgi:hypothetical protein